MNIPGFKIQIKREILIIIIIVLVFIIGLIGYIIVKSNRDIIIDAQNLTVPASSDVKEQTSSFSEINKDNLENDKDKETDHIEIYVTGCVKKQGIVTIEKGQLIDDAIKLAGGVTSDADIENINLVYKLQENTMLYIRSKKEIQLASQNETVSNEAGKGVKLVRDSGGAVLNETVSGAGTNGKININTATLEQLDTLPGIGEATAQDIINYRKSNGDFKTIQDIMKVPRIKESRFTRIKDLITVN